MGIDRGTTFTAAAVARDGRDEAVPLGNHSATILSLGFLREVEGPPTDQAVGSSNPFERAKWCADTVGQSVREVGVATSCKPERAIIETYG